LAGPRPPTWGVSKLKQITLHVEASGFQVFVKTDGQARITLDVEAASVCTNTVLQPGPRSPGALPPFPLRGLNLFSWFRLRSFSRDPPRVVTSGPGPCMLGSPGPTALVGGYIWWWPPGWVDLWGKNYGSTPQPTQEKQGREAKLS
jgi:hypothetical protein